MKYTVYGTIELNWRMTVEADSETEAEELAKSYAMDGYGLGMPVEAPDVHSVEIVDGNTS